MHKNHSKDSGLILVDILLALVLGTIFVVGAAYSSSNAEDLFETARQRNYALDLYEAHQGEFQDMMPYQSKSITIVPVASSSPEGSFGTTTIYASVRWYGNDLIQTDIAISVAGPAGIIRAIPSVEFNAIRSYPFSDIGDIAGTPLCSVDFSAKDIVGSYGFQSAHDVPLSPNLLAASIIPIALPINPTLPLTDVEVRHDIAYVSADSAAGADPDLMVIDIADAQHPRIISSINTGPGISSIVLASNRVYAAAASTAAQLHVIRFDTLVTPALEKKYSLPLPYATATPPMASSIFYDKRMVYLGTEKWDGEEISLIDVSDPAQPNRRGGFESGSKTMDIFARHGRAYIATAGEQQFIVLDVSDTMHPMLMDRFDPSGWERQEGKAVSYFEDAIHFGRTSGGFNIKKDHELFSVATSSKLSADISGGIYGLVADRSYVYGVSRVADKEFQVFDHSLSASTSAAFSLPVAPQAITCDGDKLYILAATAPMIYQVSFR